MPTKKFTQKQLEQAYEQMAAERREESQNARQAAEWLKTNLGLNGTVYVRGPHHNWGFYSMGVTPWPEEYILSLVHETYGPYKEDWLKALGGMSWAKQLGPEVFEVTTPYGVYKTAFEYFDNHCTGY